MVLKIFLINGLFFLMNGREKIKLLLVEEIWLFIESVVGKVGYCVFLKESCKIYGY